MDSGLLGWARHRWWAFVLAIIIVAVLGAAAALQVEPLHRANRQILFTVSPTFQDPDTKVNPFLNFVPNLSTALEVVSISVTNPKVAERLAPAGSRVTYGAGQSPLTEAPVMLIEVEAPSAAQADEVADGLVDRSLADLEAQQQAAGAPRDTWVAATLISSSAVPEIVRSKQIRTGLAGAAAALGLVMGCMALLLRHDIRRMRRGREAESESPIAQDTTTESASDADAPSSAASKAGGMGEPRADEIPLASDLAEASAVHALKG